MFPKEKVGRFVSLEGSDDDYGIVWLADFLPEEIEFVALKPSLEVGQYRSDVRRSSCSNPYAVQKS
jgi:hypothetical protein